MDMKNEQAEACAIVAKENNMKVRTVRAATHSYQIGKRVLKYGLMAAGALAIYGCVTRDNDTDEVTEEI
jgi:hypothetical protein